jgi:ligand-binding SRPBCC domain-containing protein
LPRIRLETPVRATPARCFDLSRDLDLHTRSFAHTHERIVGGKRGGLIGAGEEVTWRGRHFGVPLEHTARITAYDRPRHFRDEMVRGTFASFRHDHEFEPTADGTLVVDVLDWVSPLCLLGKLADVLFLRAYLERLLRTRNDVIKREAEA